MFDPFATLGVPRAFGLDIRSLEQRHRDLSRALHPDRHTQASPAERRAALERASAVNDAFRALRDPQARAAALLALAGRPIADTSRADPALLMEILELREQLEELRGRADHRAIGGLRAAVARRVGDEERVLAQAFDEGGTVQDTAALDSAYRAAIKLRYLYRFLAEAEEAEDGEA